MRRSHGVPTSVALPFHAPPRPLAEEDFTTTCKVACTFLLLLLFLLCLQLLFLVACVLSRTL